MRQPNGWQNLKLAKCKNVGKEPAFLCCWDTGNAQLAGHAGTVETQGHAIGQYQVRGVRILGNSIVPTSAILNKVLTKSGEPLIVEMVQADIAEILAMGWFSDVKVKFTETPQGVYVEYLIEENPCFHRLEVKGCTKLNLNTVNDLLYLAPGEIVNTEIVNQQLARIIKDYRDAGYAIARIQDVVLTEDGCLRIMMNEGVIETTLRRKMLPRDSRLRCRMKKLQRRVWKSRN